MSIPKLKKIKSEKKYHDLTLSDEYAWVDQPNILEVLKDANKLNPEVKNYISENNKITEDYFKDVRDLQKIFRTLLPFGCRSKKQPEQLKRLKQPGSFSITLFSFGCFLDF